MPSVLYIAVNEYAEEMDPLATRAAGRSVHGAALGAAVRANPQRDVFCGTATISASGTDTSLALPPPPPPKKGNGWQLDPELGSAFASTSGDSFKLGRGGVEGSHFCSWILPAGTKTLQTWRAAGGGSATAKHYAQAIGARKKEPFRSSR